MTQNSFQMISSAVSDRGLSEKRPQNEDSYLEMPERGLFAVADGVGGAQAGDVASQMAMEILAEAFNNLREGGDIEDLMNVAINRANGAIYQMSHELPQLSTMATTIVALQVTGNIATIGHVGDSRMYRLDSRGNLFRETQDHSVVEEEVRAGRMTPEQAENHPSKNVISRALGAESTVEIDMKTIMFEPNTTFLICSDGITRHIPDVEIRELLALTHPPVTICQQMKEICYERGAEDNLTAVIVRFSGSAVTETSDYEESTVASARQPMSEVALDKTHEFDEIPTQNLQMPAGFTENYETDKTVDLSQQANNLQADSESMGENVQIAANPGESNAVTVERYEKSYSIDEPSSSSGILGKILLFLLGLIFGVLLGAGVFYLYSTMMPKQEPPKIPQMQTLNIGYTAFEDNRRNVDKDPQKFISTMNVPAADSEDFYLLGRAQFLLGKYPEAKDSFEKAKQRLVEYKGDNKVTLQNEIAFGLAGVNNGFSQKVFESEKSGTKSANTANSNVSSNASNSNTNQKPDN